MIWCLKGVVFVPYKNDPIITHLLVLNDWLALFHKVNLIGCFILFFTYCVRVYMTSQVFDNFPHILTPLRNLLRTQSAIRKYIFNLFNSPETDYQFASWCNFITCNSWIICIFILLSSIDCHTNGQFLIKQIQTSEIGCR